MPELGESLSRRELDVLRELAQGASNKEIAQNLTISPNTVKVHVRNVFTKLGVSSRVEAVTFGMKQGIIESATPEMVVPAVEEELLTIEAEESSADIAFEMENASAPLTNGHAAVSAETQVIEQPQVIPPVAAEQKPTNQWLLPLMGLLAVIILIGGGLFIFNQLRLSEEAAPEPFEGETFGETGWSTERPSPLPISGFDLVAVGLDIYRIGGQSAENLLSTMSVYDSQTHEWREVAEKPTPVTNAGAASLAGQIYVAGGQDDSGGATATVEAYSPSADAWRAVAALPIPLNGVSTVAQNGFLYVFGGLDGTEVSAESFVYDPAADSWRPLPAMPTARAHTSAGVVANELYVVGGLDGNSAEIATCEKFNSVDESWSACTDMLRPRAFAAGASLYNKLYMLGGGEQEPLPYGEVYDPAKNEWQVVNLPMFEGDVSWLNLGLTTLETRLYALGGSVDGVEQDQALIYNPLPFNFFFPSATVGDGP